MMALKTWINHILQIGGILFALFGFLLLWILYSDPPKNPISTTALAFVSIGVGTFFACFRLFPEAIAQQPSPMTLEAWFIRAMRIFGVLFLGIGLLMMAVLTVWPPQDTSLFLLRLTALSVVCLGIQFLRNPEFPETPDPQTHPEE